MYGQVTAVCDGSRCRREVQLSSRAVPPIQEFMIFEISAPDRLNLADKVYHSEGIETCSLSPAAPKEEGYLRFFWVSAV